MASSMEVTLDHVAVGGNAVSNALSGNRAVAQCVVSGDSLLCAAFGAKNSVALASRDARTPSLLTIREMLQHRGATKDATRITTVYLYAPSSTSDDGDASSRVLAGDSEGNVLLWTQTSGKWTLRRLVSADREKIASESVSAVTAVRTQRRWLYFAAFSNGHLAVFEQLHATEEAVVCVDVKTLGVRLIMETLAVTTWEGALKKTDAATEADVLLAAGGVDSKVYLFEVASGQPSLQQLIGLEGHRGWIRAVDFERRTDGDAGESLFLASASQDHRVRLWKISAASLATAVDAGASASSAGFQAAGATSLYTVSFDALLIAHEDWVTSLVWTLLPNADDADAAPAQPALVSTSMDNTIIIWKKNASIGATGAWVPSFRVGEHGGNGVLSSVVLPSADSRVDLLALSLSGQLERWLQQPAPSKTFMPTASLMGHTSPVTDISWAPRGDYLISLSSDQTTRVLAQWRANASWHEISRAQVHGYDINCGSFIAGTTANHNDRFVCGADEKILRVFEAPDDIQSLVNAMKDAAPTEGESTTPRVEHAYLPELSLTNKSTEKKAEKSKAHQGTYTPLGGAQQIQLPVGDTLAKKTLWPELRKLYGHGNELLCVTSNHAGTLLASACKSREEKFAAVWLWNTSDWSAAQAPLEGHKSSVVQLAFSPNDACLVSVSKDRQFCVFGRRDDGSYALVDRVKAHKRIIWSCSWSPDSSLFATGARDQTVALWGADPQGKKWTQHGASIAMDSAVTAVAFAPWARCDGGDSAKSEYLLAVGLESGLIYVYKVVATRNQSSVECSVVAKIPSELTPTSTISRLSWSSASTDNDPAVPLLLASASSDHSVRLYRVLHRRA